MTNKEAIEQLICIKRIKEDFHSPVNKHDIEALELAIKALESSSWIPVTERLPEINVEVIVTDIETIGTYASWYLGEGFWECDNGKFNNRIIAWMPLPKPYTKEEQS